VGARSDRSKPTCFSFSSFPSVCHLNRSGSVLSGSEQLQSFICHFRSLARGIGLASAVFFTILSDGFNVAGV
jgi:hypothetical protein